MTCARDRWRTSAHRDLISGHGADVRFFLGHGNENPDADEIIVDEPDDYDSLPKKVRAAFQWALDRGYDYIFKADCDTYINVPALLASGYEAHEYVGLMGDEGAGGGLAHCPSGGVGYWLSARAAKIYLQHYPVYAAGHGGPFHHFEDWCLAIVMHDYVEKTGDVALRPHHDPRYWNPGALEWKFGRRELGECITLHPWEPGKVPRSFDNR